MLTFARYSTSDSVLILLVILIAISVPIIVTGIVIFAVKRNDKNRRLWNSVSKNLNLNMPTPKKLEMFGVYQNCEIKLAVGARRSNETTEFFTYCVSEFPHSLRFLLKIDAPHYLLSKFFGSNTATLGHPAFDEKFMVECYDASVLRNLLLSDFPSENSQNLAEDMIAATRVAKIIKVTDKQVYVEKTGQIGEEKILRQMLELTAYLTNRLKAARENFPLSDWEKRLFQNWQNLAGENNLHFDHKKVQIYGNYKNFPVLIALETKNDIWQTEFRLRFPQSLAAGLKIMPENSVHKALSWLGVQDIKVGISEFDDAFIVKGTNINLTKNKLQPDVCRHLIELRKRFSDILIDDNEIFITFNEMLGDEKLLKSYLEAIISTARMFSR